MYVVQPALSFSIDLEDDEPIGHRKLVKKLGNGVFEIKAELHGYSCTYSADVVLEHLESHTRQVDAQIMDTENGNI